jgi:metal-responsive CopG/Arc/MetJ family transcriptional regulator
VHSSLRTEKSMNEIQQVMVLMPAALASEAAAIAKQKMTSRSCWIRQLLADAVKKAQDAA